MQAMGNGAPQRCVQNLFLTVRGEVPYARLKGMDPTLIDQNSARAVPVLEADAQWTLENYEPRMRLDSIDLAAELARVGHFGIHIDAETKE